MVIKDEPGGRFYPSCYSVFKFEPTTDNFKIIKTDEKGEGIVSLKPFKKGEIVFKFTGKIINYQTLFTLQIMEGFYIEDPYFMGKVLHSCDPNMDCDMNNLTFTAKEDINFGDFLTMDYETTEDYLFRSFNCCCGSETCRGKISGKKVKILN